MTLYVKVRRQILPLLLPLLTCFNIGRDVGQLSQSQLIGGFISEPGLYSSNNPHQLDTIRGGQCEEGKLDSFWRTTRPNLLGEKRLRNIGCYFQGRQLCCGVIEGPRSTRILFDISLLVLPSIITLGLWYA